MCYQAAIFFDESQCAKISVWYREFSQGNYLWSESHTVENRISQLSGSSLCDFLKKLEPILSKKYGTKIVLVEPNCDTSTMTLKRTVVREAESLWEITDYIKGGRVFHTSKEEIFSSDDIKIA